MVAESWFRNFFKIPRKVVADSERELIGVLAFEVASLMSKLVHLWRSLSDKQIERLRDGITNSVGIKRLVSEDEDFIVDLICSEMLQSAHNIAQSVARLAKKCSDPNLKNFNLRFGELVRVGTDPFGWEFGSKKMDSKVKKMEGFVSANASLYREMEILADLEQAVKRMKCGHSPHENWLELQKKIILKQREVKNLRGISLWTRTYDYSVILLARSLFTIFSRIKHVFGIGYAAETNDMSSVKSDFISRSHSISAFSPSFLQKSKTSNLSGLASDPLGRFTTASGPLKSKSVRLKDFISGPLGTSSHEMDSVATEKNSLFKFHSGPLGKLLSKSGPFVGIGKASKKMWQIPEKSLFRSGRKQHLKHNQLSQAGPFKSCIVSQDGITLVKSRTTNEVSFSRFDHRLQQDSRPNLLDAPPGTLGAACLAFHYANVIIVVERFVASPHLIGDDARDDLYDMLPLNVRASLRKRLKPYTKNLGSSAVSDPVLTKEWTDAVTGILEWLGPLAHNMIKWQTERSYEHQSFVSRTNIVLVQTLYFADQQKTEAIITELLVGLNYLWRFGMELNMKPSTSVQALGIS